MTYLIIDGNHLAHRCRHAYQLSWQGQDTSVTYGFVRVLMSYAQKFKPQTIIIAWDAGTPLYRKALLRSYKANRKHADDPTYANFVMQLEELQQHLPAFGVVQVKRKGIEADDLVYHASRLLAQAPIIIVSGDADLLQAVDARTSVFKPDNKAGTIISLDNFESAVGVPRNCYEVYRALQGDSSDNLRGCKGLGPKTAQKLVKTAHSLTDPEDLLAAAPAALRPVLADYLRERYTAVLQVMTLKYDLCGARQVLLSAQWQRFDKAAVMRWCMARGFNSLIQAGSFASLFGVLRKPVWQTDGVRLPAVWSYYHDPIEK